MISLCGEMENSEESNGITRVSIGLASHIFDPIILHFVCILLNFAFVTISETYVSLLDYGILVNVPIIIIYICVCVCISITKILKETY